MNEYILYKELLERHVSIYKNKKIIILLENELHYEILSNMNDNIDLTEISWITNLRIGSKNMNNIHFINFLKCDIEYVVKLLQDEDYIVVILNSVMDRSKKVYEIYFPTKIE